MSFERSEGFGHGVPPTDPVGWLDPEPFTVEAELPKFPIAAMPSPFREMAGEIARVVQIAVDAPALLMLAILAAAGGSRFKVRIGATHTEPLAIWSVPALPSGERKTEVLRHCLAPVHAWEADELQRRGPEIIAAQEAHKLIEKKIESLRRKCAEAKHFDPKSFQDQVLQIEKNRPRIPPHPSILAQDITPEALARRMAAQRGRVLLANDEGGPFQIMAGQYSKAGNANLDVYLKGHAGSPIDSERITRGCDRIQNPALSMALIVQPYVIQAIWASEELRHRGLLARFLYALVESRVGFRSYSRTGIDPSVELRYGNAVKSILGSSMQIPDSPEFIKIDGKGLDAYIAAHDEFESLLREGAQLGELRDWGSKAPGLVARIAGAFHLLRCEYDDPCSISVNPEDIDNARDILRYGAGHVAAVLGSAESSPKVKKAKKLLAWILQNRKQSFEQRDVQQAARGWLNADEIVSVIEALEGRNYVRRVTVPSAATGRPRGGAWIVNPKLFADSPPPAQNSQNTQNRSDDVPPVAGRRSLEI